jgi:hypothetical protein
MITLMDLDDMIARTMTNKTARPRTNAHLRCEVPDWLSSNSASSAIKFLRCIGLRLFVLSGMESGAG